MVEVEVEEEAVVEEAVVEEVVEEEAVEEEVVEEEEEGIMDITIQVEEDGMVVIGDIDIIDHLDWVIILDMYLGGHLCIGLVMIVKMDVQI
jgi:hypothetical protein